MGSVISALFGYALGTAQVLILEWFTRRSRHARDLRLLRAELRRAAGFTKLFNFAAGVDPDRPTMPRAPNVSSRFIDTVTTTEFILTDGQADDDMQVRLLTIADSCDALREYLDRIREKLYALNDAAGEERLEKQKGEIQEMAAWYDEKHSEVHTAIESALEDLDARLKTTGVWHQLNRPIGGLPRQRKAV